MRISYKPEQIGDSGLWNVRRYVNGELDIIVEHKPFPNQFATQQFCRLLMRNLPNKSYKGRDVK